MDAIDHAILSGATVSSWHQRQLRKETWLFTWHEPRQIEIAVELTELERQSLARSADDIRDLICKKLLAQMKERTIRVLEHAQLLLTNDKRKP